jgi:hypothetical protein
MSMRTVAGSDDLASHAASLKLEIWRAVEAQHQVATMVLVDTLDEQALLESLLEASKPPLPDAMRSLHWLLFTPFRYPPLPSGSRFRGPAEPGVFYGADERRTACAELGYWRWRFLNDSPALDALGPIAQTLFLTPVAGRGIDLRLPPFDAMRAAWLHRLCRLPGNGAQGQAGRAAADPLCIRARPRIRRLRRAAVPYRLRCRQAFGK